ncbi:conjugal transfer protein TraF, partial [bacterium]|nr:conjugal transfer protein TraF [bacterium]
VGASAKYNSQKIDDKTGTGIGIDIGTLYQMKNITLGAAVQNFGLSKIKFIDKEESLPMIIKAGCGYKVRDALLGIDISKPNDNSIKFNLGGEYQINPVLTLRAGYNSTLDEGSGITAGFGITHRNLTFNGAYLDAGELGSTFRLSSSIRF